MKVCALVVSLLSYIYQYFTTIILLSVLPETENENLDILHPVFFQSNNTTGNQISRQTVHSRQRTLRRQTINSVQNTNRCRYWWGGNDIAQVRIFWVATSTNELITKTHGINIRLETHLKKVGVTKIITNTVSYISRLHKSAKFVKIKPMLEFFVSP